MSFYKDYKQISIYLKKDLVEKLKKEAKKQDRPLSYTIKKIIETYLIKDDT